MDREWSHHEITDEQWAQYQSATAIAEERIPKTEALSADGKAIPRWPETICFGRYEMETWYTAPFPSEYAHTKQMFFCEFCLKYMRTLQQLKRHAKKCQQWHPPGNEIYRKGNVAVFEVDGSISGIYCRNLCLLAMLYLHHKTLYDDVEPFLFYIVTKNDNKGCHFVGYFSKEKYSAKKYNLSCIVTLPCYHKQGFGRFLIDFSYLLTRREKMFGTPERPLSDLGRVSYAAYWKSALLEYLRQKIKVEKKMEFKLADVSIDTGISPEDAAKCLDSLGMFVKKENRGLEFVYKEDLVESNWRRALANKERIWLDEKALQWSPTTYTPPAGAATHDARPRPESTSEDDEMDGEEKQAVGAWPTGVAPSGVPLAACGSTIKGGPLAAAYARPAGVAADAAAAAAAPAARRSATPKARPAAVAVVADAAAPAAGRAASPKARPAVVAVVAAAAPAAAASAARRAATPKTPQQQPVRSSTRPKKMSARMQEAAAAAAESAAAVPRSSRRQQRVAATAAASAAVELAADARPTSPTGSTCSTDTIPMRHASEDADLSMMTDDEHENEGREQSPVRPESVMTEMEWDDEESEDPDRTMPMRMGEMMIGVEGDDQPASASSSSEQPPSLQMMLPIEQLQQPLEAPIEAALGALLAAAAAAAQSTSLQQQPLGLAAAAATSQPLLDLNAVGKSGASAAAAAACSTDDSEVGTPPCLSPQYVRTEDGEFSSGVGRASSNASAAPEMASSNETDEKAEDATARDEATKENDGGANEKMEEWSAVF